MQCFAIIQANIKNRPGTVTIAAQITRAVVITNADIFLNKNIAEQFTNLG
jgi:hypothetical protein